MPVTVIVGGQFGSEGKGKVAHYLAKEMGATVAIRVGGPNSGHTVIAPNGVPIIFKQLPTAALLPDTYCVLPAGSYIEVSILFDEVRLAGLNPSRLLIDPNAVVITERELTEEKSSALGASIGSTGSGTGAAVIARAARLGKAKLAGDVPELRDFLTLTSRFLRDRLSRKERLIVEGTQGFGLSVLHSPYYPFATSRDTTASAFLSEAGLSPTDADDVVLVLRALPIRVAGNSGPLPNETDWESVRFSAHSPLDLTELTSVTRRPRRIGWFDSQVVQEAVMVNNPTRIVLNHLDYVDWTVRETGSSEKVFAFIKRVEGEITRQIDFCGWGPSHMQSSTPIHALATTKTSVM